VELPEDRWSAKIAQGGSRIGRGSSGDVHFAEERYHTTAEFDDPLHGRELCWRQWLEGEELRLGQKRRERIVDLVAQLERDRAGGGQLLQRVLFSSLVLSLITHECSLSVAGGCRAD